MSDYTKQLFLFGACKSWTEIKIVVCLHLNVLFKLKWKPMLKSRQHIILMAILTKLNVTLA